MKFRNSFKTLLLTGLVLAAVQTARAACTATLTLDDNLGTNITSELNDGCALGDKATYVVEAATDTVTLSNTISIDRGAGSGVIRLIGRVSGSSGKIPMINIATGTEANSPIFDIKSPVELDSLGFLLKNDLSPFVPRVTLGSNATGSKIRDCRFHALSASLSTIDNGALLFIASGQTLIEQTLFRIANAPAADAYKALRVTGADVEIRASIFVAAPVVLHGNRFHLLANTFVGDLSNSQNPVVDSTNSSGIIIERNVFATDNKTTNSIAASNPRAASDVKNNLYASNEFAPDYSGTGTNVALAPGFVNYSQGDFPITQMDVNNYDLPPSSSVGAYSVPSTFPGFPSSIATGVSATGTLIDVNFVDYSGNNYDNAASIKAGALINSTPSGLPSPISSLAFSKGPGGDSLKMKMTTLSFNTSYYGQFVAPESLYLFFSTQSNGFNSDNISTLQNDIATDLQIAVPFSTSDSIFSVPREMRTASSFYVKVLHTNSTGQARVLNSSNVVAQVTGLPSYPVNTLNFNVVAGPTSSDPSLQFSVSIGTESNIDSVVVEILNSADAVVDTRSYPVISTNVSGEITGVPAGMHKFRAYPVGVVGGNRLTAGPTAATQLYEFGTTSQSFVYFQYKPTAECVALSPTGVRTDPLCDFSEALSSAAAATAPFTIFMIPSAEVMENITISTGTAALTIKPEQYSSTTTRQTFRGNSAPALTISRSNVTVQGLLVEQDSSGQPAVQISAAGVKFESNILRPVATSSVTGGPAIRIQNVASGTVDVWNNITWGYPTQVVLHDAASTGIRIVNNTFLEASNLAGGTPSAGIQISSGSAAATVANNFFSGITDPYHSSLEGSAITLDRNVYTVDVNRRSLTETTVLGKASAVSNVNLTGTGYLDDLKNSLEAQIVCGTGDKCSPLFAGAADSAYGNIDKDVYGKSRLVGKNEVGAFEYNHANYSYPMGLLDISASSTSSTEISYTITSMNFDSTDLQTTPGVAGTPSVFIWWGKSSGLDWISAEGTSEVSIGELYQGNITGTASGLEEGTQYYFYAAFTKTSLAYQATTQATTSVQAVSGACEPNGTTRCPSGTSVFADSATGITSYTDFLIATSSNAVVNPPQFSDTTAPANLELHPSLKAITLSFDDNNLKTTTRTQSVTTHMTFPKTDLTGWELFLLPQGSDGLPSYVASWSSTDNGSNTVISISSERSGSQTYVFAKPNITSGGFANPKFTDTDTIDFTNSNSASLNVSLKGSGFITANPLIIAGAIPAGANPGNEPFIKTYFTKPTLLNPAFSNLSTNLKTRRFKEIIDKMVATDLNGVNAFGKVPIHFNNVTESHLSSNTQLAPSDPSIGTSGNLQEISLQMDVANYSSPNENRWLTRGIEVYILVFDGGLVSYKRTIARSLFLSNLLRTGLDIESFPGKRWFLFSYPWDEISDDYGMELSVGISQLSDDLLNDFKVLKYKGTGNGADSYIEFNGENTDEFSYDSAHAIWVGARNSFNPIPLEGLSLDHQTFQLSLPANQWTDFGLPFNFPMKIKDILDSSSIASNTTIWRFEPFATEDSVNQWSPQEADSIVNPWEGLTIKPVSAATLKFPVISANRSSSALSQSKVASFNGWKAKLQFYNKTASMLIDIGQKPETWTRSSAPYVPGQNFFVALTDERRDQLFSAMYKPDVSQGGHWPVNLNIPPEGLSVKGWNESKKSVGNLYLVEAVSGNTKQLSGDKPALLKPGSSADEYYLVAGTEDYLNGVKKQLNAGALLKVKAFPNPFRNTTTITYQLPSSEKHADYRMRIFNMKGEVVYDKAVSGGNKLSHQWDGIGKGNKLVGKGFYTLRLQAKGESGKEYSSMHQILKY